MTFIIDALRVLQQDLLRAAEREVAEPSGPDDDPPTVPKLRPDDRRDRPPC